MTDQQKTNIILKLAIIVSLLSFTLWPFFKNLPFEIFYLGNALFIFLLALYIRQISKPSFSTFFLFCLALNNLLDEILFDAQKIGWNEYITSAIIIIIYFLKDKELPK